MKAVSQYCVSKFSQQLVTCIGLSLALSSAQAQLGMVIGGDSFAAACYRASSIAISNGSASRRDLEPCQRAIYDGALSRKNLVASYVNRGAIYMALGDRKSALNDFNLALDLDDKTGEAYVNRGNLWFFGNDLPKALSDYDLALQLGVEKPHIAHLNRGMARERLGKLGEAQADYQASLSYAANWSEAALRLTRVTEKIRQKNRERK
ncbi:MAG: tetratricopeptide (TPR) repeat protein [Arenicella sp.]|jgi:tetratricopeptide (TPR) repeat protein